MPASLTKQLQSLVALPLARRESETSRTRVLVLAVLVFFTAGAVRLLLWQDMHADIESGRMHFGMTDLYKADALNLLSGRLDLFIHGPAPPANAQILTHPPGYSLFLATLFKFVGDSTTAWRLVHVILDAFAAVGVFLIAWQLLPAGAAIISGALIAVSPQLAFNSLVLMPDSPSVLPLVWAVFLITCAYKKPRLSLIIGAGALIGISCWLRPTALFLSPFLALLVLLLFPRVERRRYAVALVITTFVVISPVTIRNIVFFHRLIPLSLGIGNNLCEGIADYDDQNRSGFIQKDHLVNEWEAHVYNRPDYAESLFGPDGIERDRARLKRGLDFVKRHPLWFSGVMLRRIGFMMTYERTPVISRVPAVTHSLTTTSRLTPAWSTLPAELLASGQLTVPPSTFMFAADEQALSITGSVPRDSTIFVSQFISLKPRTDYALQFPIDITEGRFVVGVTKADSRVLLASAAVPDALQGFPPDAPPVTVVQIPFASNEQRQVQVTINSAGENRMAASLGIMKLFELGESSYGWTRLPRVILRAVQKFFTTRQMLPLVFCGLALLIVGSSWRSLAILVAVPVYFLLAQSPLHTEYRYVLVIHYFLLVLAALTLYWFSFNLWRGTRELFHQVRPTSS